MIRHLLLAVGCATICAAGPIAMAGTPSNETVRAGRVEQLNLMFTSVTLRCKTVGINLQPEYDRFTGRRQAALSRAQDALKRHFDVRSAKDLHTEFDRFHIRILNYYGTGRTDAQSCGDFAQVMDRLAEMDGNDEILEQVAEIMVPDPQF